LHNNIVVCKHPHPLYLYCAIYCTILPVIAPPRPILKCFEVFGSFFFFFFFKSQISDGSRCLKKNPFSTRKWKWGIIAHYCAIPPSQSPFIAYNIAQYIFPTTPFIYCNKILAISCTVRAKLGLPEQPAAGSASQFDRSERHFECFFFLPGGILLETNLR